MTFMTFSLRKPRSLAIASAFTALFALAACDSNDQAKAPAPDKSAAAKPGTEATVDVADLMKAGPLAEQAIGKDTAPVTIIEYASMTCTHCAAFHSETSAYLKEKYIDTGKVRLIFREFPLDPLAYAGSLLARCAGEGKYFPMLDLMFSQQKTWAYAEQPEAALFNLVKQAGFTKETFDACLQDQASYDAIKKVREKASSSFGVNSTPTFFINGKIIRGSMPPKQLDTELSPFLATSEPVKK